MRRELETECAAVAHDGAFAFEDGPNFPCAEIASAFAADPPFTIEVRCDAAP